MTDAIAVQYQPAVPRARGLLYYGWVNVIVAATAMVATLLGRTQMLAPITEPLLKDLHVDHVQFGMQNMWATLIASAFSLPCGPLIDRIGARSVLLMMMAALGASILYMSGVSTSAGLFVALVLTRGFGQSALSVVSLALVGKWFTRRLPIAMGIYSILVGVGCIAMFIVVSVSVFKSDWRHVWHTIGWVLLGASVLSWLVARSTPESMGLTVDGIPPGNSSAAGELNENVGATLRQALASPAFWAYASAAAIFGMLSAALTVFNEAVLEEHGFDKHIALKVMTVVMITGLLANFGGGWLGQKVAVGKLLAGAMFLHAVSLLCLPVAHSNFVVYLYAVLMGISGGVVTVAFFTCWGTVFGRAHLGAIQGAAQALTVVVSSAGPVLLAECVKVTHSSAPLFYMLAPVVAALGVFCLLTPAPKREGF